MKTFITKMRYLIGPLLFLLIILIPMDLSPEAHRFLGVFVLTACLWLFTEIPLFVSGLFGVSLAVVLGVTDAKTAFAPFSDPIIFLFLGGFLLGQGLESTKLDQILANKALSMPGISSSPKKMAFSFLAIIFIFSMWISNTAATAMFLPLGLGLLKRLKITDPKAVSKFLILMAYSATIGGNATPIGSPPNVVAIGFLRRLSGIDISFLQWMAIALPISIVLLILAALPLNKLMPNSFQETNLPEANADKIIQQDFRTLNSAQKHLLVIFGLTVVFWVLPSILQMLTPNESSFYKFLGENLTAANVAVFFSSFLFLLPFGTPEKVLQASDIKTIDWSSLLLFGAGLSLGGILFKTGLATKMAESLSTSPLAGSYIILMIAILGLTIHFTELASNTASANILIPIIIATSKQMGQEGIIAPILVAVACNSAFMLPVATPPNAIVFGSGKVDRIQMIKAGIRMNLFSWAILALVLLLSSIHF